MVKKLGRQLGESIPRHKALREVFEKRPPEFTSLPLLSMDTLLAGIDAAFGVDAPDVSRLPSTVDLRYVTLRYG